ncbi:CPBP family intramembrane metalloprotease [Bacillaceae bacterium SIJ1]|uniref:CPBP family intramembrane glutamic endopeptidase n=1 Tax=Litoribacterium kuwaitense TaxID=1398745 RepID=UPI0013EC1902|nr:type II CAAX endopeptidase family protein [Litoribacterium kuwaitense]NGP46557.1 CPBP family intramembrane metalloprotease [Litoribacterium kuwaitense]
MKKSYWGIIVTYIFVLFGASFVALGYFQAGFAEAPAIAYGQITTSVIGFLIVLFLLRSERKEGIWRREKGASGGEAFVWIFLGVFMALAAQYIAALIEIEVLQLPAGSENTSMLMDIFTSAPLFVLYMIFFAPFFEELIFRKIIFGSIYKRTNFIIAGIVSSLAFAVLHMDFTHLLIYTAMGFVFAFLYVRTQRIIIPMLVHGLMNLIVVVGQIAAQRLYPEMYEEIQNNMNAVILLLFGGF